MSKASEAARQAYVDAGQRAIYDDYNDAMIELACRIPALCDEIRALEAENAKLKAVCEHILTHRNQFSNNIIRMAKDATGWPYGKCPQCDGELSYHEACIRCGWYDELAAGMLEEKP